MPYHLLHAQTRPVLAVLFVHGGRRGAAAGAPAVRARRGDDRRPAAADAVGPGNGAIARRAVPRAHRGDRSRAARRCAASSRSTPTRSTIADRLDAERKSRGPRGPLHGIPILLKDNIATADRMMTTAGSLALAGVRPPKDAFIVDRLREAGAVILGKTNLSEWANFRSTHSTSGWSGRGGQTRNPYALDRNPSGSSSGSGAAIAANLCAAAIGTETDGSIVSPSSSNGLVGIKPTLGLVSRSGIVPIAHSQDTAGPMARTVADAAALLGAIAGSRSGRSRRPGDAAHAGQRRDYTASLDAGGLKGARIGVVRNRLFGNNAAADRDRRSGDRRDEAAGRDDRRSGEHPDARQVRRHRVRGAALRVQGRPEQVPRPGSARRRRCTR